MIEADGLALCRNETLPVDQDPFHEQGNLRRLSLGVEEEKTVSCTEDDRSVLKHTIAVGVVLVIILVAVTDDGDVSSRRNPENIILRRSPDISLGISDQVLDTGVLQITVQTDPPDRLCIRVIQGKPVPMRSQPETAVGILPHASG